MVLFELCHFSSGWVIWGNQEANSCAPKITISHIENRVSSPTCALTLLSELSEWLWNSFAAWGQKVCAELADCRFKHIQWASILVTWWRQRSILENEATVKRDRFQKYSVYIYITRTGQFITWAKTCRVVASGGKFGIQFPIRTQFTGYFI
jgi:hypothetical protein